MPSEARYPSFPSDILRNSSPAKEELPNIHHWRLQLQEISSKHDDATIALFDVRNIINEITTRLEKGKNPNEDGLMHDVLREARKLERLLRPRKERWAGLTAKILAGVALVFGIKIGVEKIHSFSELETRLQKAKDATTELALPPIPDSSFIMHDTEIPRHEADTSGLYNDFIRMADNAFVGGLSGTTRTESKTKNFERFHIVYGPQLREFITNYDELFEADLATATGRTTEQLRFVEDVGYMALYATQASFGEGIKRVVPIVHDIIDTKKNIDWFNAEYRQTIAFLDRVFEERLKDVPAEKREDIKRELAEYLTTEVEIHAQQERLEQYLAVKNSYINADRPPSAFSGAFSKGKDSLMKQVEESIQKRDYALNALLDELERLDISKPDESKLSSLQAKLRDLSGIRTAIIDALEKEQAKGVVRADGKLCITLLERIDTKIKTLRHQYRMAMAEGKMEIAAK